MAAEHDGFAIFVATIGVAAIVRFEIDERNQPRADPDTAKPDRLGALKGRWWLSLIRRASVRPRRKQARRSRSGRSI